MIASVPSRSDVQARLTSARAEILGLGVRRLALFGSVRRDAARLDSDVDLLVEFVPGQKSYATSLRSATSSSACLAIASSW